MNTTSYRRTALALALCALTGVAFAQSSSGSSGSTGGSTSGGSPSATSPMNGGTGSGNYPSASPQPGHTNPSAGQMSPGGQPMSNGMSNGTNNGMRSPSRTDSADNAYRSLDSGNRGYLQRGDVQSLSGFNFDQADTNRDGRVTKEEFSKAWATTK